MRYKLSDYKGKSFVIQDELDDIDEQAFPMGEIDDSQLTDRFLERLIADNMYYGIPSYIGKNKELKDRIEEFEQQYNEEQTD